MAKPPKFEVVVLEPETMKVENPADYSERGYLYFSRKKFDLAAEDFNHVLGIDANNFDEKSCDAGENEICGEHNPVGRTRSKAARSQPPEDPKDQKCNQEFGAWGQNRS